MKITVVGKGGREHALVETLAQSPSSPDVFCYPGSDAIFRTAGRVGDGVDDVDSLVEWMQSEGIDLCVGGEEAWLAKGLADKARAVGIPTWGPVQASAQLEASKEFAKEFMVKHAIPTGGYDAVNTRKEAVAAIGGKYPTVLKFDGLAAGKGVAVCPDEERVNAFLDEVFEVRRFGEGRLLVEEFLEGPEVSIIAAVCDGDFQLFVPARDYKRLEDGDRGPNTGGMGAVASLQLIDADLRRTIEKEIVKPSVAGLVADGMDYRGFLYFGLMLTSTGPKMLEFNCRFGDPEAQAVLPLVGGDFAHFLSSGARGEFDKSLIKFGGDWSVGFVLASAGYPVTSRSGDRIAGLEAVSAARVFHAGTKASADGGFETHGGRVLAVVAKGETRESAREKAMAEAAKIGFPGSQRRSDIGQLHFV
ncbi:MAG: phosphoribosylamine--glycine ligase [Verrucomicrobiota bacterium]